MRDREIRAWAVRRAVYAAGFAVGLGVVVLGRGTVAEVEGWGPMIEQAATLAAAMASGFAAIKTGPDSDNARPVVPADKLAEVVDMIEPRITVSPELVDGVAGRLAELAEAAPEVPAMTGQLGELRALIEKNRGR